MATTQQPKPTTHRTCRYCEATIETMGRTIGWVDVVSGDDGGTYDYCPENPYGGHAAVTA